MTAVQNAKFIFEINYLNVIYESFFAPHGVPGLLFEALGGAALLTAVNFSLTEKSLLDQENRASFTLQA